MNTPDKTYWQRKLAALLHDSPSKCLDIPTHYEKAKSSMANAGFDEEYIGKYDNAADHTAAAADRLPFPNWRSASLTCAFDGEKNGFHHPLNGKDVLTFNPIPSSAFGEEIERSTQPIIDSMPDDWEDAKIWRARFFAHWRLWEERATENDYRFSFLPADTRIPDHTIWTHINIVSAISGCKGNPAFLKFQLGPVQDFIAAARNTRDLWSGSYLLSWLMSVGLKKLSELCGPDSVIYPSLRKQPLFDLQWKAELWNEIALTKHNNKIWKDFDHSDKDLLTPNLPNVFLAIVPKKEAVTIAKEIQKAMSQEWKKIADEVWRSCDKTGIFKLIDMDSKQQEDRYWAQVERHLQISWQVTPWPDSIDDTLAYANNLPDQDCLDRLNNLLNAFQKEMPKDHRDGRYYVSGNEGPKDKLNNVGIAWSLINAICSWELDAVRQTRDFKSWAAGGWKDRSTHNSKDALTGKEEMIIGGAGWSDKAEKSLDEPWKSLFRHSDEIGAITLIKRCWHIAYLQSKWSFPAEAFKMPSTVSIAFHKPHDATCDEDLDNNGDLSSTEKYFAIIAFDGDEIGKWISGAKTPKFKDQLASYEGGGALSYFTRESDPDQKGLLRDRFNELLNTQRPVSPSYHLQFSEALANFSRLAQPVVESYKGHLIYAGGDDVLAMLPADTAIDCANDLQLIFTGKNPTNDDLEIKVQAPGYLTIGNYKSDNGSCIPFIVPGTQASASAGIAIAHVKAPLQDVVKAAQKAEKRAKDSPLSRSAMAISLFKHSGEIHEWGCKWDSKALPLLKTIQEAMEQNKLSFKFPHRICELLMPYSTQKESQNISDFNARDIILIELNHALERQSMVIEAEKKNLIKDISEKAKTYLDSISSENPNDFIEAFTGLCKTVAFITRISNNEEE